MFLFGDAEHVWPLDFAAFRELEYGHQELLVIKNFKARMPIAMALLPLLLGICLLHTVFAQSVGDLAREERARTARENKPVKVYTNDDIRSSSAPAAATSPAKGADKKQESAKQGADAKAAPGGKEEVKKAEAPEKSQADLEKEYRDRFAKLRETQAYEQKKLDVMQRELSLMQTQFYSDPNVAVREQTFRSQINQRTQEIDQQKAAADKANKAIADLEEELRRKNLPAGWAR